MAKKKPEGIRRQQAMEKTLARFRNKAFDWAGGRTCVHLARWHLKHMGHAVPPVPKFDSAITAKRALEAKGKDVPAMLDQFLERIPPAMMTLGDIAVVPGDGMDCILICAGPRRVFGWHEEGGELPVMIEPNMEQVIGAWRV